ncbi:Hypothetical predicted protein, partial [Paramuricea clavata]
LQARKRALRTADEGPSAQHSRCQSTRNSTLASRSTVVVAAEDDSSGIPLSNVPPNHGSATQSRTGPINSVYRCSGSHPPTGSDFTSPHFAN